MSTSIVSIDSTTSAIQVGGVEVIRLSSTPPSPNDNSTKAATTSYVDTAVFNTNEIPNVGTKGVGILKWGALNLPQNATNYAYGLGNAVSSTETRAGFFAPRDMTLSELRVKLNANVPASNSLVVRLRVDYTATALDCTVAAGASTASNVVTTVQVKAGQFIAVALNTTATFTSTIDVGLSIKCSDSTNSYGVPPLTFNTYTNGGTQPYAISEPGSPSQPGSIAPISIPPCYVTPIFKGMPVATTGGIVAQANTLQTLLNGVEQPFTNSLINFNGATTKLGRMTFAEGDTLAVNMVTTTSEVDCAAFYVENLTAKNYPPCFTYLTSQNQAQATTMYMGGYGTGGNTTVENEVQFPMPACTVKNLRVTCSAAVSATTTVITIRNNGVDTAVTATLTTSTTTASDLTHTATFAAGDLLTIKVVSGATTGTRNYSATFEMVE